MLELGGWLWLVVVHTGANVNAQTFTKGTALTYACENGHTEVAELLVHHGAELVTTAFCRLSDVTL